MECEYCNRKIKNRGYTGHIKTCKKVQDIKEEVIRLYIEDFMNIKKISEKYNIGKEIVIRILGDKKRTQSESNKLAHKLYPESYKHTEESKQKMREKRLEYMKNNPDKTAWRLSNMSYPEKLFLNKIKELEWGKKHLIVREHSIFPYFVDFAFINEKVAIEIDGSQHLLEERKLSDDKKDELLISKGWRVLRITAKEVNKNLDNVINRLSTFLISDVEYEKFGILTNTELKKLTKYHCKCGNEKTKYGKNCIKCGSVSQRKVERPPYKQLIEEISELGYTRTGRKYNVSDNAIRKWIKYYNK